MLISGIFSFIGDTAQEMIVGLFLLIDSLVYTCISWLYQLFCVLSSFRLFNNNMYDSITSSIYTIIGVVALFIIAYELLNMIINIDKNSNGENIKKIILNIITSMILIVITPTLFDFLFDFQNSIIGNNVIGKLILPTYNLETMEELVLNYESKNEEIQTTADSLKDISDKVSNEDFNYYLLQYYGNSTATQIFQAFFYPTGANVETFSNAANNIETKGNGAGWITKIVAYGSCGFVVAAAAGVSAATALIGSPSLGAAAAYCASVIAIDGIGNYIIDVTSDKYSLEEAYSYAAMYGDFNVFQAFSDKIIENEITYNYILSTIVGIVVIYILAIYCLDLGVRAVKLAVYQILAPIPIFLKIIPKQEKIFNNWWKAVLTTYVEIFIRMFILYFAVFLISNIPDIMFNIFLGNNTPYADNLIIYLLTRTIIILGILIFVKQAPKLIEEITGIKSGNFSLNIMDHIKEASWAPAAIGGLIAGHGNPLAMIRAGANGWKNNNLQGIGAEGTRRRQLNEARANGSTWIGRMAERGRNALGLETGVEALDRNLEDGIDPRTRTVFNAQNDTANEIDIRDENGRLIRRIAIGQNIDMDRNTQQQITTAKQYNATQLSDIQETIRHITDSESSNERFKQLRSTLKKEAEEKIREEKSTVEDTITAMGRTFTGNLASMYEYRDQRKLNGASEDEIKELTKQIGLAQDRMWEAYADSAISGTMLSNGTIINNERIRNISDQMALLYTQDGLQSNPGQAYDRTADSRGLNGLSGLALVEALDKAAKSYNNNLVLDKQREENRKAGIQEQNTGLDRLNAQLKEQQDLVKQSHHYRATQANTNQIKNNNRR